MEFRELKITAPDGSIIGIIDEGGEPFILPGAKLVRAGDALPDTPGNYVLDYALSRSWDAVFESVYDAYDEAITIDRNQKAKKSQQEADRLKK